MASCTNNVILRSLHTDKNRIWLKIFDLYIPTTFKKKISKWMDGTISSQTVQCAFKAVSSSQAGGQGQFQFPYGDMSPAEVL